MSKNSDAEHWFVTEIIIEIQVGSNKTNVVHTNTILIQAPNAEEAYNKTIQLGKAEESEYENPNGEMVVSKFKGIRDINQIYDDLEDGAELFYEEDIGVPEEKINSWVKPKDQLAIFRQSEKPKNMPDYSSGEITEAYNEYIKKQTT